jgi:hypothetical protein
MSRIQKLVEKKKIKRFDLTASIDCLGRDQEYVRYGLDLVTWRKNFEHVIAESWIYLNINQTLSALTIKTIPDLIDYINQFNNDREINQFMSTTVMTHDFLHPKIFGAGFFDKDFSAIITRMKDHTWIQQQARKYLQGLIADINTCSRDQVRINQLATYLTELDRRRGLNWQETFPWLTNEIAHVL